MMLLTLTPAVDRQTINKAIFFNQHRSELKAMSKKVQGFVHVPDGMIRTEMMSLTR
jgi:hypothetical protein